MSMGGASAGGPYTVYAAGGLFSLHEVAANVLIKEAVWRLSGGKFELVLPQSREQRDLDRPDVVAYVRNSDLVQVVETDMIAARFDGLELDSGTVVEFITAKFLGKPAVILRSDFRHLSSAVFEAPFNLMVRSWSRTVDVYVGSTVGYFSQFTRACEALGGRDTFECTLQAERNAVQKCVDELADKLIAGLERAAEMVSPYPPEYREVVYRAARYAPGSGFDQLLTEDAVEGIVERLRANGTL